jgi:hypothetical protein
VSADDLVIRSGHVVTMDLRALHRDWDSWSGPGAPGRAGRGG